MRKGGRSTLKEVCNESDEHYQCHELNSLNEKYGKLSKHLAYAIMHHCMGNRLTVEECNFPADNFLRLKSNIVIRPQQ